MKAKEINFILPIGYEDKDGEFHREGTMRQASALDEIEIHNNEEKSVMHNRYRDCLIFAQVITKIGKITKIESHIIEDLFEVDFLYLQILYNNLNIDNNEYLETRCPDCQNADQIYLPDLYKEMHKYFSEKNNENPPKPPGGGL